MTFNNEPGAVLEAPFSESDFELLAAAIDTVPETQRALFLTKLVILLTAGTPPGTLEERLGRARKHLHSVNKETS
ncbi:hypothetical protein [Variovorax fucosicus]|uniref:hypothetical protein n=1 Tax=Variovorax fucosicus TaxID=3053517 RepID=UPI0025751BAE|nr:hypothetical protein [Variovorax sp. J22G47]MDM0058918.1 hypothetical protein [Variovorax sp. J22G47]